MRLTRLQCILKPPQLIQTAEPKGLGRNTQTHAASKATIEDIEAAVGLQTQQEELTGLIGRECQRDTVIRHPRRELARGGQLKARSLGILCGGSVVHGYHDQGSTQIVAIVLFARAKPTSAAYSMGRNRYGGEIGHAVTATGWRL
jgi:hypothetical protein